MDIKTAKGKLPLYFPHVEFIVSRDSAMNMYSSSGESKSALSSNLKVSGSNICAITANRNYSINFRQAKRMMHDVCKKTYLKTVQRFNAINKHYNGLSNSFECTQEKNSPATNIQITSTTFITEITEMLNKLKHKLKKREDDITKLKKKIKNLQQENNELKLTVSQYKTALKFSELVNINPLTQQKKLTKEIAVDTSETKLPIKIQEDFKQQEFTFKSNKRNLSINTPKTSYNELHFNLTTNKFEEKSQCLSALEQCFEEITKAPTILSTLSTIIK